ncbi:DUF2809 domain-containing protein [Bradyrhizobium prioriisuperbiae]|uniref:ribosomal maturation YjgA family protein n=1 Tax=Bradyrhizobium prioriisuperbiae TaxID=2854389 RepID=UPI0028E71F54|nr:DUF2809 domain-containing protein [Bradyrhizobium prioritasuperba]
MKPSTADLKSLHHLPQTRPRDFRSKSGTRIIDLLVPLMHPKFVSESAAMYHELRMRGTSRTIYLLVCCLLIGAGLLSRAPVLGLPPVVAKSSGSVIWGAMVYVAVASLIPIQPLLRRTAITALIAIATEFSQLVHFGWLDAFRRTTFGVLLIGRFFSWWDIVCYLAGIAIAMGIDRLMTSRRRPPRGHERSVSTPRPTSGLSSSGER